MYHSFYDELIRYSHFEMLNGRRQMTNRNSRLKEQKYCMKINISSFYNIKIYE